MDHHHGPKRKIQNIQVEENPQISEISSGDRRKRQLPKKQIKSKFKRTKQDTSENQTNQQTKTKRSGSPFEKITAKINGND